MAEDNEARFEEAHAAFNGIEVKHEAWHVWRIRDGLAIEFRAFDEKEDAVRAAQAPPDRHA